jgi:lantibiotic modifying enzyme
MDKQPFEDVAIEPNRSSWHPILAGEVRERALEAVREIAAELNGRNWLERSDPSLENGTPGLAILFTYLDRAFPGNGYDDIALMFLNQALSALETEHMGLSFYGGISGIAWAIAHIEGEPSGAEGENPYEAIDDVLAEFLAQSSWEGDYDLVAGLVGLGVYALERLPHPRAVDCLRRVIGHLDKTAERGGDGRLTWHTAPHLLPPHQQQECPQGYYNLGVAHGVPGVIALLGEACAANVAREKARPLLDGAVAWLLSQKRTDGAGLSVPAWTGPDFERNTRKLAWCYGDLGLSAT